GERGQSYAAPYFDYKAYNFPINAGAKVDFAEYRRSRSLGAFEFGWTPNARWQLSSALEYGRDAARLRIGAPEFPNFSSEFGGGVLRAVYDDLDASGFPAHGTRVHASQEILLTGLGSSSAANITRLRWDSAWSADANHWLIGGSVDSSTGSAHNTQIAAFS